MNWIFNIYSYKSKALKWFICFNISQIEDTKDRQVQARLVDINKERLVRVFRSNSQLTEEEDQTNRGLLYTTKNDNHNYAGDYFSF